jgi:hypothetical protein
MAKVKLSLVFNYAPWGSVSYLHSFLTSAVDGSEWSTSCLIQFVPSDRAAGICLIGGWMDPRASMEKVASDKYLTVLGTECQLSGP